MRKTPENRKLPSFATGSAIKTLGSVAACFIVVFLFALSARSSAGDELILIALNGACLLSASGIAVFEPEQKTRFRLSLLLFSAAAILLALYLPAARYGLLEKMKNLSVVRSIILSSGKLGLLCYFALTYLSVVVLPVPAAVLIVAGTYVYGPWISFAVSASATFVGSITCFFLGRKLGKKLLYWLFDREKVDKYAAILGKKGKIPFVLMMFLPFFPDDLICMSAGVTDMKFGFFALSTAIARTAYIFTISFLGSGDIIPFKGWGIAVWAGIFALCVILSAAVGKFASGKNRKKQENQPKGNSV